MSKIQTQVFYIVIIIVSSFFAFHSQVVAEEDGKKKNKLKKISFLLSFLIPWFVIAFTNIGSDYKNYYYIIDRLTWSNYNIFSSEEPIMNVVFLVIRNIVQNTDITIFMIKTITIMIVYYGFYLTKDKLKVGYAVLAYLLLVYLPSFYLLTIALAAAIVYLAFILRIYKNKKTIPILLILFAAQLHNSAYMIFPMYILMTIFMNNKQVTVKRVLACIAYVSVVIFSSFIFEYFSSSISGFHYKGYGSNSYSGTGAMVFFTYIPLLLLYFFIIKYNKNIKMNSIFFVFVLTSIMFKVLSYKFRVIERMEYYILPLFCCIIPSILFENNLDRLKNGNRIVITRILFFFLAYLIFRGVLVFIERTTSSSGVGLYNFFNPF